MLRQLWTLFGFDHHEEKINRSSRRPPMRFECLEDRSLLTAMANLTAFRPVTEYINYSSHPVLDSVEASPTLGPGIRINGDDDNRDGRADYNDVTPLAAADNDLVRVDVSETGTSSVVSWAGSLAVWSSPSKAAAIANGDAVGAGQSLWVEYVSQTQTVGSLTSVTLTTADSTDGTSASDTVVFHSFQSVVIAIGGNSQDPANFGDARLGAFTMGGALYDRGYDVHLYAHSQIQSTGRGAAYDEVVSAVLNRNVDHVAIFGYSWGGGATYELSAGLNANTTLKPAGYSLDYTAYIDGIRHGTISSETRLPVGTKYHDNYFQRKDWLLRGNSVTGAQSNLNVTLTSWGKNFVHTTIDDSAVLQDLVLSKLVIRLVV